MSANTVILAAPVGSSMCVRTNRLHGSRSTRARARGSNSSSSPPPADRNVSGRGRNHIRLSIRYRDEIRKHTHTHTHCMSPTCEEMRKTVENANDRHHDCGFPVERNGTTGEQWRCRRSTERGVSVVGGGLAAAAAAEATGARPVVATEPRPPPDGHAPLLFPWAGYGAAACHDGCRRSGGGTVSAATAAAAAFRQ